MKKLPTGELYAGEPHVQFGGRGRREPFPTPIKGYVTSLRFSPSRQLCGVEADGRYALLHSLLLQCSGAAYELSEQVGRDLLHPLGRDQEKPGGLNAPASDA